MPTPQNQDYRSVFGVPELTMTVIFATYAVRVIDPQLLLGRRSEWIGGGRCCFRGSRSRGLNAVASLLADIRGASSLTVACAWLADTRRA